MPNIDAKQRTIVSITWLITTIVFECANPKELAIVSTPPPGKNRNLFTNVLWRKAIKRRFVSIDDKMKH